MMGFKINSVKPELIIEDWRISFKFDTKKWEVKVSTRNGVVYGGPDDNVAIDNMDYFSYSDAVRKEHFDAFKKAIMGKKNANEIPTIDNSDGKVPKVQKDKKVHK